MVPLHSGLSGLTIAEGMDMKSLSSFATGGKAEYYAEPKTIHDAVSLLEIAYAKNLPVTIIGAGTHILVSDSGIPGMVISTAGSVVIIFIGIRLILAKSAEIGSRSAGTSIPRIISSAFAVTWLNPQAIIDGTMMLGAFHASLPELGIVPFITGVASASCMWFLCLSSAISLTSRHFTPKILRMINIICGVVITFYGIRIMLV